MVKNFTTNLDLSKASGLDFIPVVVLKDLNLESCFPNSGEIKSNAPVFKNIEDRSAAKSHHSVIRCGVSKIFEKILDHLEKFFFM